MDQAEGLRSLLKNTPGQMDPPGPQEDRTGEATLKWPKVISVSSGKGGVGKTNVTANLGLAFTQLGKKVLILDADLGLANIDVLLGITARYSIEHLFRREKKFSEILVQGPGGMLIMPASSGVLELVDLEESQKIFLLNELDHLSMNVDVLLIDTGAGISSNVLYFNMAAAESIILATPEPTSITDAYALMKVLSMKFQKKNFMILVNLASGAQEAKEVFKKLNIAVDRFLGSLSLDYLGFIPLDESISKAVKLQKAVLEIYPRSLFSKRIRELAKTISERPVTRCGNGNVQFFWKQLLQYKA
ncbi:MAG: MinD/ParA family protein [Thermodesulfobacteriota bacterium]